jgi:glycosyltransferase involved in cell wall biosynthesis
VVYSGNLGIGHEFETLLDAFAVASSQHSQLILLFIGGGSRLSEVQESVIARGLSDRVVFKNFVPSAQLSESLGLADVCLVTLRPGFEGLIVPSKIFGYIARGLPVLYIGPAGDTSELIAEANSGLHFLNRDVAGLAAALSTVVTNPELFQKMGMQGRNYYEKYLSRSRAMQSYANAVRKCVAEGAFS